MAIVKRLLTLALLAGCGAPLEPDAAECGAELQGAAEEKALQFNPWNAYGDRAELWDTMVYALDRVRDATCLDVDVTLNVDEHRIRWAPDEEMPSGASGYITGANWDEQRIRLRWSMPEHHRAPVLVHEVIHALRKSYAHPCPVDSMSNPVTSASRGRITQCDLDLVCAKQDCGCQVPELP